MKRVFICSPYRGNVKRNRLIAEELCRRVIAEGNAPYAPHLYLTDVLDDNDPEQREKGIACGIEFLRNCDEILVYCPKENFRLISDGMSREMKCAAFNNIKIVFYSEPVKFHSPYKLAGYFMAHQEAITR